MYKMSAEGIVSFNHLSMQGMQSSVLEKRSSNWYKKTESVEMREPNPSKSGLVQTSKEVLESVLGDSLKCFQCNIYRFNLLYINFYFITR